jgi:hypothetical protein
MQGKTVFLEIHIRIERERKREKENAESRQTRYRIAVKHSTVQQFTPYRPSFKVAVALTIAGANWVTPSEAAVAARRLSLPSNTTRVIFALVPRSSHF